MHQICEITTKKIQESHDVVLESSRQGLEEEKVTSPCSKQKKQKKRMTTYQVVVIKAERCPSNNSIEAIM